MEILYTEQKKRLNKSGKPKETFGILEVKEVKNCETRRINEGMPTMNDLL